MSGRINAQTGSSLSAVGTRPGTAGAAAVATITGSGIIGQPLTATLPSGVIGTLQFTKTLKASPFTKSNISGAVASAVNSLSYTVQSADAPYSLGCDVSNTVSSSNAIVVQAATPTAPGQPAKPVLTAMAGAVSLAWTPGAAGSTATTGNIWTDINGNVTQLTTNPQTITTPAGTPYTGTVTSLSAQGAGPASDQADAVTPLVAAPVPTSFSWIIKNTIFGSSAYAAQVGFHNPGRTSILFHNDTPYWGQYVLSGASNNDYNQPTGSWVDIPPNAQVLVTDPGKPYVRGKAFAITSITSDGATATATTAAPHNLATGASVRVQDVTPAGYNGAFTSVTVTGANTFTYPLAATLAATTASGTWAGRPLTGFTVQTKAAK